MTQRDVKKLAEKERRQLEEAARLKEAALADDDNVFDVAFEAQGGGADAANTVSATDIKARLSAAGPRGCHAAQRRGGRRGAACERAAPVGSGKPVYTGSG